MGRSEIFGTSEIGIGYHMTTATCYDEMSTFQYRMLTFQGDQDFKTSTCQNIDTKKLHAAGGVNHST